jgi:mono/diheme cytochrome c family protein
MQIPGSGGWQPRRPGPGRPASAQVSRGSAAWRWLQLLTFAGSVLLAFTIGSTVTEGQDPDVLKDPVVLGAWLYEGHCVACHGPYAQARLARLYGDEADLRAAIEGGGRGCQVAWSTRNGGPLRGAEIKALTQYMLTWESLGAAPNLPPLPPQPTATPTPLPTPTASTAATREATPTPTPTPELDPQIRLIIEGSELARGAWLFTQNCYRCHLDYGYSRMARGLSAPKVEATIKSGKIGTSMPAFGRREGGDLSISDIRSIVRYIMAFEQLDAPPALPAGLLRPPTPDPSKLARIPLPEIPRASGDARAGARWYVQYCARCHGLAGEGGIGPILAKPWPSVRPDLTVKAAIAAGVPGTAMRAWDQAAGGELTGQQIDDLVTYILHMTPPPPTAAASSGIALSPFRRIH